MATKPAPNEVALDVEEALDLIDKTMERVKALYEQYFLGIQKQPPTFIHNDLERKLRDLQQVQIRNTALRYRYATLQQKFGSYNSYWRRTLRQIENGTYGRSLAKLGRKAVETGAEIPEEILAKMPKRMREAVRRDREAALAMQQRRKQHAGEAAADTGDFYEEFAPSTPPVARVDARGAHLLDADDGDLDLDAFFAQVQAEEEDEATTSGPPPQPEPAHSAIATTPSTPAVQRASVLGGMPRAQSPTVRAQTNPGVAMPGSPTPTGQMPAMRQSGPMQAINPSQSGQMPAMRQSGPMQAINPSQSGQMPASASGQMPAQQIPAQRSSTSPGSPSQSGQMPASASASGQMPAQRSSTIPGSPSQSGQMPASASGPMPAQRPSGQMPAQRSSTIPGSPSQSGQLPASASGQLPASASQSGQMPAQRSSTIPGSPSQSGQMPTQRPSGQLPAQPTPPARPSGQRPVVPMPASSSQTGPVPRVPMPAPGQQPAFRPTPTPQPGQRTTNPTGLPTIPSPAGQMPAIPRMPSAPFAPSQGVRPNPIAPGSAASKQVGVETMQGPFAREPSVAVPPRRSKRDTDLDSLSEATPTSPAVMVQTSPTPPRPSQPIRTTPTPQPMRPASTPQRPAQPLGRTTPTGGNAAIRPPGRPPPGMSDADVDNLYKKYVQAKEMVGEQTNAQTYGKLLNTINAQAPKIMEQYKAKGVDFSVVVKDNQVIIKAKPKP